MVWEQVGGRRYYYRSQWIAGRSVRRYVGTGPVAEMAAAADDLRKLRRVIADRELKAEQTRRHQAEAPLLACCENPPNSGNGLGFEGDLVTQPFQLPH